MTPSARHQCICLEHVAESCGFEHDDAQKEMMSMGTKRHLHEESIVIKSAMKTKQTPGSAVRKSKDFLW